MISVTTILSYNNKITAQGKAMDYRWLDALHIMAGVIWLGGIFMMAAIVAAWSQSRSAVAKGESNPLLCAPLEPVRHFTGHDFAVGPGYCPNVKG